MSDEIRRIGTLASEIAESEAERTLIARALDLLAYAAEPEEPLPGLRDRILAPEAGEAAFEVDGFFFARAARIEWIEVAPGVRIKWLFRDATTGARTGLIEMGPGLPFPEHPHPETEDLYLIAGEAWVGDVHMRAGDYCRSPAGTVHRDVRSGPAGALALVVSR